MPQSLLEEWKAFDSLDPDFSERADWGFAHVVQALIRNGKPLREFLLPLGDYEPVTAAPVTQTLEYQQRMIDAWVFSSNAIFKAKETKTRA